MGSLRYTDVIDRASLTKDCIEEVRLWPGCETVHSVAILQDAPVHFDAQGVSSAMGSKPEVRRALLRVRSTQESGRRARQRAGRTHPLLLEAIPAPAHAQPIGGRQPLRLSFHCKRCSCALFVSYSRGSDKIDVRRTLRTEARLVLSGCEPASSLLPARWPARISILQKHHQGCLCAL